jgi:hypothetical protein
MLPFTRQYDYGRVDKHNTTRLMNHITTSIIIVTSIDLSTIVHPPIFV